VSVNLYALTFDCGDAAGLASFWSAVLERPVDEGASADVASIALGDRQPHWYFMKVPEGKTVKNRVHADLVTTDLAAEVRRLVDLGAAARAEFDEGGFQWVTLQDPEGNEFDVVASGE
jgi:predicted enzyme related to lactoylglutathione lyase